MGLSGWLDRAPLIGATVIPHAIYLHSRLTLVVAVLAATMVLALNVVLLLQTAGVPVSPSGSN